MNWFLFETRSEAQLRINCGCPPVSTIVLYKTNPKPNHPDCVIKMLTLRKWHASQLWVLLNLNDASGSNRISVLVRKGVSLSIYPPIHLSVRLSIQTTCGGPVVEFSPNVWDVMGSFPSHVMPKSLKMVLDASLLSAQLSKVRSWKCGQISTAEELTKTTHLLLL